MEEKFCIGNTTKEELIEKRAQWLHDHGRWRRGYYREAEKQVNDFPSMGQDEAWLIDISYLVRRWCETDDPKVAINIIIRSTLETVCDAYADFRHQITYGNFNKITKMKKYTAGLFNELADTYSEELHEQQDNQAV